MTIFAIVINSTDLESLKPHCFHGFSQILPAKLIQKAANYVHVNWREELTPTEVTSHNSTVYS